MSPPPDTASSSGPAAPRNVYAEPTNRCNLACRTCMRRAWDEPQSVME